MKAIIVNCKMKTQYPGQKGDICIQKKINSKNTKVKEYQRTNT